VKGKIVLVAGGLPPGPEWQAPGFARRYGPTSRSGRDRARQELAASLGARALLVIDGGAFSADPAEAPNVPASYFTAFEADVPSPLPVVYISPRAGDALLAEVRPTTSSVGEVPPQALPGTSVTVRVSGEEHLVISRNVVGVLRGADPAHAGEAVVLGAHLDHLGRVRDVIHPGADDDASGVAGLLEIARAWAASPAKPARTVVFAFWTGEEEGHFGSDHYVRHPLWPLERTAVYLNLDMIGHPCKPEELRQLVSDARLERGDEFLSKVTPSNFVELGVAEWATDVMAVLVRAARGTGLAMHLDRTDGRSGGSDYRAFARRGVPFVRFFGNYFDGYHEPGDTAEKLDPNQVLTMTRVALASAWLLASP
jgi:Zn-dependent M28 family amino/carboxypeptidase